MSDYHLLKLDIKTTEETESLETSCKCNNSLLNENWVKTKKMEIFLELDKIKQTTDLILQDTMKEVLRGKFIGKTMKQTNKQTNKQTDLARSSNRNLTRYLKALPKAKRNNYM